MVYRFILVTTIFVSSVFASINFEELKTFKSEFTQLVINESGKTISYKGEVFIKNNGKVLWKYKTPIVKNVYLIDDLVIVDEPELEQAIYTKLEKEINMLKLMKEANKIDKDLYKANLYNTNYFITIKDDKIKSLSYQDELSNKISINFSDPEQNVEIKDQIFIFLAPKHYDIIEK